MACSATPPAHWAQGGMPIALGQAYWERDSDLIEILPDGTITENGKERLLIDQVGRVYYKNGDPYALLLPNGHLVGEDNIGMGEVGPVSASFPGSAFAWMAIDPAGQLIRYDQDGNEYHDGKWSGCQGPMSRTCMLVSHVIALGEWQRRPRVGVGVGVGVMMPLN